MPGSVKFIGGAGFFLILMGFFAYQAWVDLQVGKRKRAWRYIAGIIPLGIVGAFVFWIGIHYPTVDFSGAPGFGPGWTCQNLGRAAAQVCTQDGPTHP